jgi:hypothetical protein
MKLKNRRLDSREYGVMGDEGLVVRIQDSGCRKLII